MPDDFTSLRDRIAQVLIRDAFGMTTETSAYRQADAVIEALDLGIPCANDACRMRQIARRSADKLRLTGDGA